MPELREDLLRVWGAGLDHVLRDVLPGEPAPPEPLAEEVRLLGPYVSFGPEDWRLLALWLTGRGYPRPHRTARLGLVIDVYETGPPILQRRKGGPSRL